MCEIRKLNENFINSCKRAISKNYSISEEQRVITAQQSCGELTTNSGLVDFFTF